MRKIILSASLFILMFSKSKACAWYDPDFEYFSLFTQSIIKDKTYLPFLHTLSNRFYGHEHFEIPNENIESWQSFFGNSLTYNETKTLVENMPMKDLNTFKKGASGNAILSKLGSYTKHAEALDYLIEAKYLEPFMRINYIENPDSFYYSAEENSQNATKLNYTKTVAALTSLYHAAKNPEIKLRYGYQLVRFNHYTRNYEESVQAFNRYVAPLRLKTAPYYLALDQLAGAQRGAKKTADANWNFFQVFINSKSRKESAFVSMKLADSASFNHLMNRAQTPQEKNMAYFLLAYEDFSNPIPMMEKMYEIDPNSEILKVLAARSINELERSYLPVYYYDNSNSTKTNYVNAKTVKQEKEPVEQISFWEKVVNFFKNIFSSPENRSGDANKSQNDRELLDHKNRIPFYAENNGNLFAEENRGSNFVDDFAKFTSKTKEKSGDAFWQIADAYLSFLQKDYTKSAETLSKIQTQNPEYRTEINRMKMLNDIVSQPQIDAGFEEHLMKDYPELFATQKPSDSLAEYGFHTPSTSDFIQDILANRYFLQGEDGKSFLMSNMLSDLQYNPNSKLVKSVEDFYKKPNKTSFEIQLIKNKTDDVGDPDAFFNVMYGDREMRLANFSKAKTYYEKAKAFTGIPRVNVNYDDQGKPVSNKMNFGNSYDGYKNIPQLIFGHSLWESFESELNKTMKPENLSDFRFIKNKMDKAELADALIQLQKIGNGKDGKAAKASQLIGNVLYNTSILGYFREVFVMDVDNSNGGKYQFYNTEQPPFQYYYKNYNSTSFIEPDRFDLAINYYKHALEISSDQEQKARILFQMASAEQGKYYQYEAKNSQPANYDDPDWSKKQDDREKTMNQIKNEKYRTFFAELKKNYSQTETSKALQASCLYYDYFLRRN